MFRNFLKNYFDFSRSEQNGIIFLLFLIGLVQLIGIIVRIYQPNTVNSTKYNASRELIERKVITETKSTSIKYNTHFNEKNNYNRKITTEKIELNTADSSKLCSLKGIGPVYASRIIKYRKYLRGYYNINQLTEVYGITPELINTIKSGVRVDTTYILPISLQPDSSKALFHHPYITFNEAKAIANYIKRNKLVCKASNLLDNNIITQEKYMKLRPYFEK